MLRKRYYILFVARDEEGRVRKIPLPLHYAYGFVAAALIGAFTIAGLAGSYTRMLLKTERVNKVLAESATLRKNYQQMAQTVHDRDVQVASLGALASEVTALYGMRQNRLVETHTPTTSVANAATPESLAVADNVNAQNVKASIDTFYALRNQAMSGRVSRAIESGLSSSFRGDWTVLADAPSLWPVEGRLGSGFGERQDPINGEGAFHPGIDIEALSGTPVRAAGDGVVSDAKMGSGYGREITLDHGHDVVTVYGHLSVIAVTPGEHVSRGQVIGYVGQTGRATGPHLHYEVRVHMVPVNPHKYLHTTYNEFSAELSHPSGTHGS
ncbi:MAG TPA: M23 family metallopeptidase [Terracidiphilus sp.]|jgi:murein DD-endopeptidase MepM/ murein hydrolase activator NlpD